ncbi:MAG TPA: hypothetical protein VFO52_07700 [Longimicrobiales bacterium]|nr:hypothetical protein [Longimicrobiales bacterium]
MVPVTRSLEAISTGHFVFEKDQVLTHDQLNSLAQYADDQIRLTRVHLLGVGIVCGLRVTQAGGAITISRGVGITSDGDLLYVAEDTTYDQFKEYDKSFPAYAPLYVDRDVAGDMIPVFELVARGVTDERARPLSAFAAASDRSLDEMTAILLMESYIKDDDLCSGTDCDNLGREAVHTQKLLLMDRNNAASLRESYATPQDAFRQLNVLVAERPNFPTALNSPAALGTIFRNACTNIHTRLLVELPRILEACGAFLGDTIDENTVSGWTARLNSIRADFANTPANAQYYYDFLKDLADTYNEFREQLAGDIAVCVPAFDSFPKHLLLGDLAGADRSANRTGFYPSPLSAHAHDLEHARFLLRKLGALLDRFAVPGGSNNAIRVTPSAFEDSTLSARAIPFYYQSDIHRDWSYPATRRGLATQLYSYHADAYDTQGLASNPLTLQIARYPFFRIEGHVGRNATTAVTELENQIKSRNLPFGVRAVLLGTERGRIVIKRPPRFGDLKHLHYMFRQDAVHRLDEVERFSTSFRTKVDSAVNAGTVKDAPEENEGVALRATADESSTAVKTKAADAGRKLNRSYAQYRADPTWEDDLKETLRSASTFKLALSPVVKTEFNTPYDNIIAAPHLEWLGWLDQIIGRKEEVQEERLLFSKFAAQHPELEHAGGVTRGGTFVLAYDNSGTVVADFMLPYYCCEEEEEEVEPPLKKPVRPDVLIDSGIRIIPSRTTFVGRKLIEFEPRINERIDLQKQSFDTFKESYLNVFRDSLDVIRNRESVTPDLGGNFTDRYLGLLVQENHIRTQRLEVLQQEAAVSGLPTERQEFLAAEIQTAEEDLAHTIRRTTEYVSTTNKDVTVGSEGMTAMLEVSSGMTRIAEPTVLERTRTELDTVRTGTQNSGLRVVLGGMLGR